MTLYHLFILVAGVYACSTAVIFIKMSGLHPVLLASYRLLVAVLLLAPLFLRDMRVHGISWRRLPLSRTLLPGVLLGIHFITWIIGARMTGAANASLIVNLVPVVMPFLVREGTTRGEILGTLMAMGGIGFLGAADYRIGPETFTGDVLCLISMFFFAGYLAIGRRSRTTPGIWLFIVPLYAVAGVFCLIVSTAFTNPIQTYPPRELLLILALGAIPTVLGHSALLYAMKHMRSQVVAIGTLGQFIFAGLMAYVLLDEVPDGSFYLAGILLVAGAVIAIRATPVRPSAPPDK